MKKAGVKNPKAAFHVGNTIEKDVYGAVAAGWNALHLYENFDEQFMDWYHVDKTLEEVEATSEKAGEVFRWGRKDVSLGIEWVELWGLDQVLHRFGFPEDDNRLVRTTRLRGFLEDFET